MDDGENVVPFRSLRTVSQPPEVETPLGVVLEALRVGRPTASEDWLRVNLAELKPRILAAVRRIVAQRDDQWRAALEEADPVLAKKVTLHLPGRPS